MSEPESKPVDDRPGSSVQSDAVRDAIVEKVLVAEKAVVAAEAVADLLEARLGLVTSAIANLKLVARAAGIGLTTMPETAAETTKPLPTGMSGWVSAEDVMKALGCSRSKAHEHLRAAAGRSVGTGHLLRVPVDVWEAWSRENLIDGRRKKQWDHEARAARPSTSTSAVASGGAGTTTATGPRCGVAPGPRTRRRLALDSPSGSERPLIPTLRDRR